MRLLAFFPIFFCDHGEYSILNFVSIYVTEFGSVSRSVSGAHNAINKRFIELKKYVFLVKELWTIVVKELPLC